MDEIIYTVDTFPYEKIKDYPVVKRRPGNQGTRQTKFKYLDVLTAFDIETTNDFTDPEPVAYMYIWQYQFGEYTVIGRSWEEWLKYLDLVKEQLPDNVKVVIYVHNLSFEFTFLKGVYPFDQEEVFATEPRKVLKCTMFDTFEYRCSYFLTNMSLDEFTHKMGVSDAKIRGFDYSVLRYPWSDLTEEELLYCISDVKGLVQALRIQFETDGDNLYTVPLTSTGYVRRDVRKAMRSYNKQDLKEQLPDYEVFRMLREAFRGGNTHANRYYSDLIIPDVKSYDRVSSYPDVQLNHRFPLSPWIHEDPEKLDCDRAMRKIIKHGRACLMRVAFENIQLRDPLFGCPYLPKAKCRTVLNGDFDNGRILSADYLETTLTDVDFRIVMEQYDFRYITFIDFYHSRYGLLPKQLRNTIMSYFQSKTDLKGVAGQEVYYMKVKNKLNSIYGMSVQSPVKQSIDYIDDDFVERIEPESELLDKSNKKAFQNYAWGVWTTAWARWELEQAIKLAGNGFVYCDTDSVKYIGDVDFSEYNNNHMELSKKNEAFASDPEGNEHYLGVYEFDGDYKNFITMGAKKYAYEYRDGSIGITVAGVAKTKGGEELAAAGGLKEFKDGFVFREAGGTESLYNDIPYGKGYDIIREGKRIHITSYVVIKESEYTLGITGEYRQLLERCDVWRNVFDR